MGNFSEKAMGEKKKMSNSEVFMIGKVGKPDDLFLSI